MKVIAVFIPVLIMMLLTISCGSPPAEGTNDVDNKTPKYKIIQYISNPPYEIVNYTNKRVNLNGGGYLWFIDIGTNEEIMISGNIRIVILPERIPNEKVSDNTVGR